LLIQKKFSIFACRILYLTLKNNTIMRSLGYLGAFFGGALAGAVIGLLLAPEKGADTRVKITDAVDDFMKKHNIKLSRKEVNDLIDDIAEAAPEVDA
jgi:gas vesicle protein